MPSQTDIELAAKLVLRQLLTKEQGHLCLQLLATHEEKHPGLTLERVVAKKGFLSEAQLKVFRRAEGLLYGEEQFGNYRLLEKVGDGGMSTVYRAVPLEPSGEGSTDLEESPQPVALKLLLPRLKKDPIAVGRFRDEAKLLMRLDHQNVVKGYELAVCEGFPFFAMEFVDGASILDHLRDRGVFQEDAALYVIMQIAESLRYLQRNGVVHRDVKPGNILLTRDNVVKLCDLGLAHQAEATGSSQDPADSTVGTAHYISPEQAKGQGDVDIRSDIYSLGVTLYQMVIGKLPFEGADDQEIIAQRLLDSLSSPMVKSRSLSPHLHYFIHKMMARERDVRYQDPRELIDDIREQIRGKKTLDYEVEAADGDDVELEKPFEEVSKPSFPTRKTGERKVVPGGEKKKREIKERLRIRRLKSKRKRR